MKLRVIPILLVASQIIYSLAAHKPFWVFDRWVFTAFGITILWAFLQCPTGRFDD